MCPFDYTAVAGYWKVCAQLVGCSYSNLPSLVGPQSLCNRTSWWRCFVLSICPFDISVGVRAFVIGLSQIDLFLFSLVFDPSTALYRSFLKHYTLTNKAMGTIWRDLPESPQRRQGPDLRPLWLQVGTHSVLGPELPARRTKHSLLWRIS